MRTLVALIAATPLALVVACQGNTDSETDTALATEEMEVTQPGMATTTDGAEEGDISAVTLADNDVSGDYTVAGEDGTSSRLRLNSQDMSYSYTGADGVERTGNYSYADDYRLMIEDYDGEDAWFSYDNSSLYRLGSADALPTDRITVTARYDRDNTNAAQTGGPGATTNSVADKRD